MLIINYYINAVMRYGKKNLNKNDKLFEDNNIIENNNNIDEIKEHDYYNKY